MEIETVEHLKAFLSPFTCDLEGYTGLVVTDRSQEDAKSNKRWGSFREFFPDVANGDIDLPFEVLADSHDLEVYFTPAVLSEKSRLEAKYAASNTVWIDFDEEVDWQHFDPAPSIVVQTSEQKHHCYWLLTEPLTDGNDQRYMNKKFLEFFAGGDESGFDATQLLKLPWGKNLKFGSQNEDGTPFAPRVLKFEPELRYSEVGLAHMPEPTPPDKMAALSVIPDMPEADRGWATYLEEFEFALTDALAARVSNLQTGGEEKRSGTLYNLTRSLLDALTSPEDVFHVLLGSPNDKFTADHGAVKGAHLLWKDVTRIAAKREQDIAKKAPTDLNFVDATYDNKELNPNQKGNMISDYVLEKLEETGVFVQSVIGECFYYDQQNKMAAKVYTVDDKDVSPFAGLICGRFKINPGTLRSILSGVLKNAITRCRSKPKLKFHYFAFYDVETNKVYVDSYNGQMYVLDGRTVEVQPHGVDDVYFYGGNSEFPIPFQYNPEYTQGGLEFYVLDGPNYTTQGHRITRPEIHHLLKTWVSSFFFIDRMETKPIVLMHGAAGSGKTALFQNLSIMFTGDSSQAVTAIPTKTEAFDLQVTQSSYLFYDNVEVNKKEMQEKLAQVATGYTVKQRELYTTSDMVTVKSRAFVGITSRTIDRIQDDVVQRYIIVPVHPFTSNKDHQMKPMSKILKDVSDNRDALWSELLDFVNKIVLQIERQDVDASTTTLRMADYGAMLELTSAITGTSPKKVENFIQSMQDEVVGENDPLFAALKKVVELPNHASDRRYTPTELFDLLKKVNRKVVTQYSSANKCGRQLKVFIGNGSLERSGFIVTPHTVGHNSYYTIQDTRDEEGIE